MTDNAKTRNDQIVTKVYDSIYHHRAGSITYPTRGTVLNALNDVARAKDEEIRSIIIKIRDDKTDLTDEYGVFVSELLYGSPLRMTCDTILKELEARR